MKSLHHLRTPLRVQKPRLACISGQREREARSWWIVRDLVWLQPPFPPSSHFICVLPHTDTDSNWIRFCQTAARHLKSPPIQIVDCSSVSRPLCAKKNDFPIQRPIVLVLLSSCWRLTLFIIFSLRMWMLLLILRPPLEAGVKLFAGKFGWKPHSTSNLTFIDSWCCRREGSNFRSLRISLEWFYSVSG